MPFFENLAIYQKYQKLAIFENLTNFEIRRFFENRGIFWKFGNFSKFGNFRKYGDFCRWQRNLTIIANEVILQDQPKKFQFFVNNGSRRGPIKIWLNYKKFSLLFGTCLGTLIFKIGPHVQKLHLVTFFCQIGFLLLLVRGKRDKIDFVDSVTFERMDRF